jgi:hypothetical protein
MFWTNSRRKTSARVNKLKEIQIRKFGERITVKKTIRFLLRIVLFHFAPAKSDDERLLSAFGRARRPITGEWLRRLFTDLFFQSSFIKDFGLSDKKQSRKIYFFSSISY